MLNLISKSPFIVYPDLLFALEGKGYCSWVPIQAIVILPKNCPG